LIEGRNSAAQYTGVLTNAPVFIKAINKGDSLSFGPEHIAQTIIKKSDPRWFDCADKKALVSEMAFEKDEVVRFAYRETPDDDEDSGWRLFTGHESDEYTDDS